MCPLLGFKTLHAKTFHPLVCLFVFGKGQSLLTMNHFYYWTFPPHIFQFLKGKLYMCTCVHYCKWSCLEWNPNCLVIWRFSFVCMKFGMPSLHMYFNCTWKDMCSQEFTLFFQLPPILEVIHCLFKTQMKVCK